MNIRSLTVGAALPLDEADRATLISRLGEFAGTGKASLEAAGFTVQTTRLSTQPLEEWVEPGESALSTVAALGEAVGRAGIDYCSLGTIQAAERSDDEAALGLQDALAEMLLKVPNCFGSIQVGVRREGGEGAVNLEAVRASAWVIRALADGSALGHCRAALGAAFV